MNHNCKKKYIVGKKIKKTKKEQEGEQFLIRQNPRNGSAKVKHSRG